MLYAGEKKLARWQPTNRFAEDLGRGSWGPVKGAPALAKAIAGLKLAGAAEER